jgi:hypothetical protein
LARFNSAAALIALACAAEAGTAVVCIADPSLVAELLFGAPLEITGQLLGRFVGFALLSLAAASSPRFGANDVLIPPLTPFLLFSRLAAANLLYIGVRAETVGLLLWPAAIAHSIVAILLFWFRASLRSQPQQERSAK